MNIENDTAEASFERVKQSVTKLISDYKKVRAALVGLVGVDTKEELDFAERMILAFPSAETDEDDKATINALRALRDTLED